MREGNVNNELCITLNNSLVCIITLQVVINLRKQNQYIFFPHIASCKQFIWKLKVKENNLNKRVHNYKKSTRIRLLLIRIRLRKSYGTLNYIRNLDQILCW